MIGPFAISLHIISSTWARRGMREMHRVQVGGLLSSKRAGGSNLQQLIAKAP